MTIRVLVTGSRHWTDASIIDAALDKLHTGQGISAIIEGGAKGADTIAGKWAVRNSVTRLTFTGQWHRYGKSAGPIRNALMIQDGKPDLVLAFPLEDSIGTWDCVSKANEAAIEVRAFKGVDSSE